MTISRQLLRIYNEQGANTNWIQLKKGPTESSHDSVQGIVVVGWLAVVRAEVIKDILFIQQVICYYFFLLVYFYFLL